MVREIVRIQERTILIHRYNTLDDTFIEYFKPKSSNTVYKNVWKPMDHTEHYEGK